MQTQQNLLLLLPVDSDWGACQRAAVPYRHDIRFGAALARMLGRNVHARGVDRVARLLHTPDRQRRPIRGVVTARDGSRFRVSTDSFLEWTLWVYGGYEFEVADVMRRIVRPGDTAVDVGANIGIHTITLARAVGPEGRVYAFEPFVEVRERLEENLRLNYLENVVVSDDALLDYDGEAHLSPPETCNRATSSISADGATVIPCRRLDSLGIRNVRLLKIDVEGVEPAVLRGAVSTIERDRPPILVETVPDTEAAEDTTAFLQEIGYRCERLNAIISLATPG